MTKRSPRLTEYQKVRILEGYDKGTSVEVMADVLGIKANTISGFRSRFMADFGLPPKEKLKKTKITAAMGVMIKKIARNSKNTGTRKMEQILKRELPNEPWYPSYKTIQRYLTYNKFKLKKHALKPFISEENRLKRIQFAKNWIGEESDKLGVVIWSDETMIRSHPFTRRHTSWVHENDKTPIQEKHHTGKYSVMFWGCVSVVGCGPLSVVEGTMDAKNYKSFLKKELFGEAKYLVDKGYDVKLMHDNAPAHSSREIKAIIDESGYDFLDWPPYSPDLNPIENVWAWIKYKLYSEFPPAESPEELIQYVFKCWNDLDQEMVQNYCKDYNKRLHAVLKAKGLQTKY